MKNNIDLRSLSIMYHLRHDVRANINVNGNTITLRYYY
jgi:hypothetical protein